MFCIFRDEREIGTTRIGTSVNLKLPSHITGRFFLKEIDFFLKGSTAIIRYFDHSQIDTNIMERDATTLFRGHRQYKKTLYTTGSAVVATP